MKKNDRVYVDFISESSTEFSGNRFTGQGVLDRVEDGRVYGRRVDGVPFMCLESDVTLVPDNPNKSGVRVITPKGTWFVGFDRGRVITHELQAERLNWLSMVWLKKRRKTS